MCKLELQQNVLISVWSNFPRDHKAFWKDHGFIIRSSVLIFCNSCILVVLAPIVIWPWTVTLPLTNAMSLCVKGKQQYLYLTGEKPRMGEWQTINQHLNLFYSIHVNISFSCLSCLLKSPRQYYCFLAHVPSISTLCPLPLIYSFIQWLLRATLLGHGLFLRASPNQDKSTQTKENFFWTSDRYLLFLSFCSCFEVQ